jgi:hypothetical protein
MEQHSKLPSGDFPSQGVEDKYENTLYELRAAMALLWQSLTYVPYVIQMDGISIQEAMPMIVLTLPRFTNS